MLRMVIQDRYQMKIIMDDEDDVLIAWKDPLSDKGTNTNTKIVLIAWKAPLSKLRDARQSANTALTSSFVNLQPQ